MVHWAAGYITVRQATLENGNKMNEICTMLFIAILSSVPSEGNGVFDEVIDAVDSNDSKILIRNKITTDQSFLIVFKGGYLFICPDQADRVTYLSSKFGLFEGRFNEKTEKKNDLLLNKIKAIRLDKEDAVIIASVVDGMNFVVSNNGKLLYYPDPIILFLSRDDRYSKNLDSLLSSVIELLFNLSKFDQVVNSYMKLSVDGFDILLILMNL